MRLRELQIGELFHPKFCSNKIYRKVTTYSSGCCSKINAVETESGYEMWFNEDIKITKVENNDS